MLYVWLTLGGAGGRAGNKSVKNMIQIPVERRASSHRSYPQESLQSLYPLR